MANIFNADNAAAVASPLGGMSLAGKLLGGNQTPLNQQGVDPNLIKAQQAQLSQANDYRKNLGSTQEDQFRQSQNQARNQLAQQINQTRTNANSRGLLYSGIRQGAEAGAGANASANLANQKANINQSTLDQANKMEQGAIQAGMDVQQAQNQANQANYQGTLNQYNQRNAAAKGLLGAVGGMAGTAGGM